MKAWQLFACWLAFKVALKQAWIDPPGELSGWFICGIVISVVAYVAFFGWSHGLAKGIAGNVER